MSTKTLANIILSLLMVALSTFKIVPKYPTISVNITSIQYYLTCNLGSLTQTGTDSRLDFSYNVFRCQGLTMNGFLSLLEMISLLSLMILGE